MYNEVVTKLQKKSRCKDPYLDLVKTFHRLHIKFSSIAGARINPTTFSWIVIQSGLDVSENSCMSVSSSMSFF
jgi:hypothetical protein